MLTADAVQLLKSSFASILLNEAVFLGETTLEMRREDLHEGLAFLKSSCGYDTLTDLTGVDYLEPVKRTKVVYWLHNPLDYQRLRIVHYVERGGALPSITDIWAGAEWYERELWDLFGVSFEDHPDLKRILMPDEWQGHPLRKDYALTEVPVQFKNNVKPKVPSEIIPYVKIGKAK